MLAVDKRQQPAHAAGRALRHLNVLRHVRMIVDKPLHAALEAGKTVDDFRLERLDCEERDETDHGADLKVVLFPVRQLKQVVVETVFFVPERDAVRAEVVHRMGNVDEVFEEFAGDIFVGGIFLREFERDREHVEAIHTHPACAVGLFEMATGWERRGAVEDSDVVETKKAALENVGALRIFAIDPPGEVEKQLVKNLFEEGAIADTAHATFNFVNAPGRPGVNGGIYVAESPFVSGKLAVRMHVPFAKEKDELLFGEIGIDESE